MALTPEEKKWVLKALDEADRGVVDKILASLKSFSDWLANTLYSIYLKIKDGLQSFWQSIRNVFS
jgi:hypothetical protein